MPLSLVWSHFSRVSKSRHSNSQSVRLRPNSMVAPKAVSPSEGLDRLRLNPADTRIVDVSAHGQNSLMMQQASSKFQAICCTGSRFEWRDLCVSANRPIGFHFQFGPKSYRSLRLSQVASRESRLVIDPSRLVSALGRNIDRPKRPEQRQRNPQSP